MTNAGNSQADRGIQVSLNNDRSFLSRAAGALVVPISVLAAVLAIPQMKESARQAIAVCVGIIGLLLLIAGSRRPESDTPLGKAILSFAAIGVLLFTLIHLPVGKYLCKPLLLPHSAGNADAIFVLASGVSEQGEYTYAGLQRVLHGAELLRAGRAPLLILSTGDPTPERPIPEAAWVASLTAFIGIPNQACEILTGGITTTRTEARRAAQLLLPRGIRRLLLVTNGPHIRRAASMFGAAGFEVLPAPVQSEKTIRNACDGNFGLFRYAIHEWLGMALYHLRGDFANP